VSESIDALIVGGGLAGLTTALGLIEDGQHVVVLEQDVRLGGRASSWIDETTGDPVHIGPHIFLSEYPNTWRLFDRLGTRDKVVFQPPGSFVTMVDGQSVTEIGESDLPPPLTYLPSLIRAKAVPLMDGMANWPVTRLALQCTESDFKRLDRINARALLTGMGVPESFIDWYWSFTCLSILNVPLELCSAGALLRFYRFQVAHKGIRVGFADGGLGDLFAPQALQAIQESGGQVLLETQVAEFVNQGDSVVGVRLADGRVFSARTVVSAIPPGALRALLPTDTIRKHRVFADLVRFRPVPYISVYLWFQEKLTALQFWARSYDANDLCCDFYDLSNIHTGWSERPSLITTNIIYSHRAEHLSDDQIVAAVVAELSEFLPQAASAELTHSRVHRIPMAIHCPFPGTEHARPSARSPLPGLYLAGDWTDTAFPSSMEGAVRSGWLCAEAILADLGRPRVLAQESAPDEGLVPWIARLPKSWRARRMMRMLGK
jgi:15-cis-phytoene desaturase